MNELAVQQQQAEVYSFLRHSLEKSKAVDAALEAVINRMELIEANVIGIQAQITNDKNEVSKILKQVKDSVYLYYEEQKQMQSLVGQQANNVAHERYNQDDIPWDEREDYGAEIRELAGYATRKQWKALKDRFEVTRYSSIRRVDFEAAMQFLREFPMEKPFLAEFEEWQEQRRRKQEREARWEQ